MDSVIHVRDTLDHSTTIATNTKTFQTFLLASTLLSRSSIMYWKLSGHETYGCFAVNKPLRMEEEVVSPAQSLKFGCDPLVCRGGQRIREKPDDLEMETRRINKSS